MNEWIFNTIINTAQDCVFWKDKQRRFVGVNQAFLDFYGFESADVLIGKTDEDMGWHSDPEPFKADELRVLAGESTYKAQGKCMVHGEERDIIATKTPLYDGDEVIGLVGSFLDVTDVIRRNSMLDSAQVYYTREMLRRYPYFDDILDDIPLEEILDPLTGVMSRGYALGFVHQLIASNTPFTFAMVDLDNFKHINDSFGHHGGDGVLKSVCRNMAEFTGDRGIVGRFGGDELLLVNLEDTGLKAKQDFFEELYNCGRVFRRNIELEEGAPFITATTGCATFPYDTASYDELFSLMDKTLYQGKSKGRNCYIVYIEAAHKDLEMKNIRKKGVYTVMAEISSIYQEASFHGDGSCDGINAVWPYLKDVLSIPDLYYITEGGRMYHIPDLENPEDIGDISGLMTDDLITGNSLKPMDETFSKFHNALVKHDVGSKMITKIKGIGTYGYLMCTDPHPMRIWQENECAVMFFLAKLVAVDREIESVFEHGED